MKHIPSVAALMANVAVPFERARAMPPEVYTDPGFLDLEVKQVFAKEWFALGRASSLKEPGDYLTFELAGQPIFVIRDQDGKLRGMSNVEAMSPAVQAGRSELNSRRMSIVRSAVELAPSGRRADFFA